MQNNKDKEKNRSFPSNNPFRLYSFYLIDYLKDTRVRVKKVSIKVGNLVSFL